MDGLKRMYQDQEDWIYYITLTNDNYQMPAMPKGAAEGIVRGLYKFSSRDAGESKLSVQLFGSGAILNEVVRAQKILAEQYGVASNVWSVTSYKELWRDAQACERWNMLHPAEPPRTSYVEKALAGLDGPFIAASDNVRGVPQLVDPWIPGGLYTLGTDGFGRSEDRAPLRRFFEVDAESVVIAGLYRLAQLGKLDRAVVAKAIQELGVDPEKPNPVRW
jgi:pyruvate dehydrogenase E1 component